MNNEQFIMLNYYQPFLLPFLRRKKYVLPKGLSQIYYHSFEDGLWDILRQRKIPQGAKILLPDFYCMDVVENIQKHGFRVQYYKLDNQLRISSEELAVLVDKIRPAVLIIFHACGILNEVIESRDIIVIEDSVHLLLNPEKVTVRNENHFIIDSLRKVSPLYGSFVYSVPGVLSVNSSKAVTLYFFVTHIYYLFFKLVFVFGVLSKLSYFVNFAHIHLLKAHDNIVGDRFESTYGFFLYAWVHQFFDFEKIEKLKTEQTQLYDLYLKKVNVLDLSMADASKLHAYPLVFNSRPDKALEEILHKNNAIVWFKYPVCSWSEDKSVLFLPLGFHVSNKEIRTVCLLISNSSNYSKS